MLMPRSSGSKSVGKHEMFKSRPSEATIDVTKLRGTTVQMLELWTFQGIIGHCPALFQSYVES